MYIPPSNCVYEDGVELAVCPAPLWGSGVCQTRLSAERCGSLKECLNQPCPLLFPACGYTAAWGEPVLLGDIGGDWQWGWQEFYNSSIPPGKKNVIINHCLFVLRIIFTLRELKTSDYYREMVSVSVQLWHKKLNLMILKPLFLVPLYSNKNMAWVSYKTSIIFFWSAWGAATVPTDSWTRVTAL